MHSQDQALCKGIYYALDCLTWSDFGVEIFMLAVSVASFGVVAYRLTQFRSRANYTEEQWTLLKYSKMLHWHLLAYLALFALSFIVAITSFLCIQVGKDKIQSQLVISLAMVFWLLLYGYITLLNMVFTVIAYIYLVKSKVLRHQAQSKTQYIGFVSVWVLQLLSYLGYFYLVFTYDSSSINKLEIMRIANMFWSFCTLVLIAYTFFAVYLKIKRAAFISTSVKKAERNNVILLVIFHLVRIIIELGNITPLVCNMGSRYDYYYSIYLFLAHVFINVAPFVFIFMSFKPPEAWFKDSMLFNEE